MPPKALKSRSTRHRLGNCCSIHLSYGGALCFRWLARHQSTRLGRSCEYRWGILGNPLDGFGFVRQSIELIELLLLSP